MHTLQSDRKMIESKEDFVDFQKTLFLVFKKLQKILGQEKARPTHLEKKSQTCYRNSDSLSLSDFLELELEDQTQSPTIDGQTPKPAHLRLTYQLLLTTGLARTPKSLREPNFFDPYKGPYDDLDEQADLEKEQEKIEGQFPYPQKIEKLKLIPTKVIESIQSLVCVYTTDFEEMIKRGLPPFQAHRYLPRKPASAYFSVESKVDCACDAFRMFNIPEPTPYQKACMLGYNGPSLSVGDIVETLDLQSFKAYNFLCQNQGWESRKISPSFDPIQLHKIWGITEDQNKNQNGADTGKISKKSEVAEMLKV